MTTNYLYKNVNSNFLEISGEDSADFLQNLITNDIYKMQNNNILYSCLLTPQGKFSSDFFIYKNNDSFILETHKKFYKELINKLNIYKLRSKIEIKDIINKYSFVIFGNIKINNSYDIFITDPRNINLGKKLIQTDKTITTSSSIEEIDEIKFHEIHIKNHVPYAPLDLITNKSLLLENNFEKINGISWDKGCYVGQEITARMKYRALLKKQIYSLKIVSGNINIQDKIVIDNNLIGEVISKANNYLLCMLNIKLIQNQFEEKNNLKLDNSIILEFL